MRAGFTIALAAGALLVASLPAVAQAPRQDVVWARSTDGAPITLDGHLNEAVWAQAESVLILFKQDNGIPGSGYKYEAGVAPYDSTRAMLKFLTVGDYLYIGARMPDQSIGGGNDWARFDGLLMNLMNHSSPNRPVPPQELFYVWWDENGSGPNGPSAMPTFISGNTIAPSGVGKYADSAYAARSAAQIANWDAVTVIDGAPNTDAVNDVAWTVEMRINLATSGYNITQAQGDTLEWNIAIWDCDWFWPIDGARFASNRVWWQSPWGNTSWYNEVKIHARPSVNVSSGPVPSTGPDLRIYQAANDPAPTIDGSLSESVWSRAGKFDIRYGDYGLIQGYPGVGKWRSGFFQPNVNGGQAAVVDPGDATVYYFWKGTNLYLGFDVRDQAVQSYTIDDRWDGFYITMVERVTRDLEDKNLKPRRVAFRVGTTGTPPAVTPIAQAAYHLGTLITQGKAQVALQLKPGTTLDTLGLDTDAGYTAELRVDLTGLGYAADLGDHWLFLGVTLYDGDSFDPFTDSYGTRAWWFVERDGENGPAWAYLDPAVVTGIGDPDQPIASRLSLLGNSPNPFASRTSIRWAMPTPGRVELLVYDVQGRLVATQPLGVKPAGSHNHVFDGRSLESGLYLYRLRVLDPEGAAVLGTLTGKLLLAH